MAKIFGKAAVAIAALTMAAGPALATSAQSLSLRASTKAKKASDIGGTRVVAIVGLLAIIGGGIYLASDDESPDSP